MDQKEFEVQLKEALSHIFDYAALETHPLVAAFPVPESYQKSRSEYFQELVQATIDDFQPSKIPYSVGAIEWRPYLILHERFVKGTTLAEIAGLLSLSERQVRRDQSRAVQALAVRLWRKLNDGAAPAHSEAPARAYASQPQPLDLNMLVLGVLTVMEKRLVEEELVPTVVLQESSPLALADRVVVRQILISMMNYALHLQSDEPGLQIKTVDQGAWAVVEVSFDVSEQWSYWANNEHANLLDSIEYWRKQLQAEFSGDYPAPGQPGRAGLTLKLPRADRAVVLVVDDQEPTQRMYQRYLAHQELKVVGVSNPEQALPLAVQLQPALITLDVMMPNVDGWEILQALQTDERTRHIPVLVCSAWAEPELARSLGAAGFLKKPVTQRDLLQALTELNLVT